MPVALDPNVVIASLKHRESFELVKYLWDHTMSQRADLRIAKDEANVLKSEYKRCLAWLESKGQKTLDTFFLSELLDYWDEWTCEKSADVNAEVLQFLRSQGCISILEVGLIGLAANSDVTLGVVGTDTICEGLQARVVVHKKELISSLRSYLKDLAIISSEGAVACLEENFHGLRFEDKVTEWVKHYFGTKRYPWAVSRPSLKYLDGIGDVDVLARDQEMDPQRVLVCECKLRMPNNSGKLVNEEEIQQLVKVSEIVKEHEKKKADDEGYNVRVYALLVSNASGITHSAHKLAEENKVVVYKVRMPRDWYRHTYWEIQSYALMPVVKLDSQFCDVALPITD